MSYADYGYYKDTFLGNEIAENDFPRFAQRASERVDSITRFRAAACFEDDPDPIANATCAIAEVIQQAERGNLYAANAASAGTGPSVGSVQSEVVGKYHITYNAPTNTMTENGQRAIDKAIMSAASTYLTHTGLLYRGVAHW